MMLTELPLVFFGKLPSRGDFVRSKSHITETNAIDDWVSQALVDSETLLAIDTAISFSHIDTAAKRIITGVLLASHDSSNRRYPLIGFAINYLDKPKSWMNYLPIKSLAIWDNVHKTLLDAQSETDNHRAINTLSACQLPIDESASTHYYDFINTMTLESIAEQTQQSKSQLIQQIIATGLLFLPTLSKGFLGLNKTLSWSLTADRQSAIQLATFWQDLIHGFYQPHELCFNTYIFRGSDKYRMVLSFGAPDGHLLGQLPLLDSGLPEDWVNMENSAWTEDYISDDIGLSRFNHILLQDQLYLYDTRQLFKKIFLAQ